MTIEEEFFKCFGIKGEVNYTCPVDCGIEPPQMRFRCPNCEMNNTKTYIIYPEITDRILLELICILIEYDEFLVMHTKLDIETLKTNVLGRLLLLHNFDLKEEKLELFKHQVQSLFKGVGE